MKYCGYSKYCAAVNACRRFGVTCGFILASAVKTEAMYCSEHSVNNYVTDGLHNP